MTDWHRTAAEDIFRDHFSQRNKSLKEKTLKEITERISQAEPKPVGEVGQLIADLKKITVNEEGIIADAARALKEKQREIEGLRGKLEDAKRIEKALIGKADIKLHEPTPDE